VPFERHACGGAFLAPNPLLPIIDPLCPAPFLRERTAPDLSFWPGPVRGLAPSPRAAQQAGTTPSCLSGKPDYPASPAGSPGRQGEPRSATWRENQLWPKGAFTLDASPWHTVAKG